MHNRQNKLMVIESEYWLPLIGGIIEKWHKEPSGVLEIFAILSWVMILW